jgi:hypothetical protein
MKLFFRVLAFSMLAIPSFGPLCFAQSSEGIQIRKLVIESSTLPNRDRKQVVRQFEGCRYEGASDPVAQELGERIRAALRNLGYFEAAAADPKMSFVASDRRKRIADVRVRVQAGAQYRLGEIQFTGAKAFPAARVRAVFQLQKGELFNATKFGAGLEHLRTLYGTAGYINLVAIPQPIKDDSRHVIDWTVDIEEGKTYNFGRLILDGPEPHAGAGYALLDSWTLEGKRYNPVVMREWLVANQSNWQDGSRVADPTTFMSDPETGVVNVKLSFPEDQLGQIDSNQRPRVVTTAR